MTVFDKHASSYLGYKIVNYVLNEYQKATCLFEIQQRFVFGHVQNKN